MIIQAVTSENGGQEGNWIAFLCALILIVGALLLPYNSENTAQQNIEPFQISIKDLTTQPLSMIADLRLADEEIRYLHEANQAWPSVTQLEQDWVAPFVKDKSWAHQGEHHWLQVMPGLYQSQPAKGGARYLLNSQHDALDIWIDLDQQASLIIAEPSSVNLTPLSASQLIKSGWTQVLFASDESDADHH